jgi:exopolysaccharide biosynthesis WecB/TagA/CpsF family protein
MREFPGPTRRSSNELPPHLAADPDRRKTRRPKSTIVRLHDCDLDNFTAIAAEFGSNHFAYVVTPNVDHLIRYCEDDSFRALYDDAGYVLLDSRLFSHVIGIARHIRLRVCTGSDLTERLLSKVVSADDRIVLVGGSAQQAMQLAQRYNLRSLKHWCPPMGFLKDPDAVEQCLRFIEANSPFRFCFLAVGSPQQEVLANRLGKRGIAHGLTLCVGAAIDYLTGVERRAPGWMQRRGIEWSFRLLQNPTRLAYRYLIRGPRIFLLLRHMQLELQLPMLERVLTDGHLNSLATNSHVVDVDVNAIR